MADIEAAEREAAKLAASTFKDFNEGTALETSDQVVQELARDILADMNRRGGNRFRRVLTGVRRAVRAGSHYQVRLGLALTPCRNGELPLPEGATAPAVEPAGSPCERRYSLTDEVDKEVRARLRAPEEVERGASRWELEYLGAGTQGVKPLPATLWFDSSLE